MIFKQPNIFSLIVEFEDIDAYGVVHHPNYLKYLERARSVAMKKCGYGLDKLISAGLSLALSEVSANYLRPALLAQELLVVTRIISIGKASLSISQDIFLKSSICENTDIQCQLLVNPIFSSQTKLVCVDFNSGKIRSIPLEFKDLIKVLIDPKT